MPRALLLVTLTLVACSSRPSLEGAWVSDRDRTLAELEASGAFGPEQWSFLSDPELFGNLVLVYEDGRAVSGLDGRCGAPMQFETLRTDGDRLTIRYYDELLEDMNERQVTVDGDQLYMPMSVYGVATRETFSRISNAEAVRRQPCLGALWEEPGA